MKEHMKQTVGIALCAIPCANLLWFGSLFGWDVVRDVYDDHQTSVSQRQSITSANLKLQDQLKAKPATVTNTFTQTAALPAPAPDPRVARLGTWLAMVAAIRRDATSFNPVKFIVSDNGPVGLEIRSVIADACGNVDSEFPGSGTQQTIRLCSSTTGPVYTSPDISDGIGLFVQEPIMLDKPMLGEALTKTLSGWFSVKPLPNIPSGFLDNIHPLPNERIVWIAVGPGSPWKESNPFLRQGVKESDLPSLSGYHGHLKERLSVIGADLKTYIDAIVPEADENKAYRGTGRSDGAVIASYRSANYGNRKGGMRSIQLLLKDVRDNTPLNVLDVFALASDPKTAGEIRQIAKRLIEISQSPEVAKLQ